MSQNPNRKFLGFGFLSFELAHSPSPLHYLLCAAILGSGFWILRFAICLSQNPKPKTQNPKPKTQNPKRKRKTQNPVCGGSVGPAPKGNQNPNPKTPNPKPKPDMNLEKCLSLGPPAQNPNPKTQNPKPRRGPLDHSLDGVLLV